MALETTVLIISNSGVTAELLRSMLAADSSYHIVNVVKSAYEALECLKIQVPDLLIMEIMTPKIEDFESLRKIMEIKPIPLLVICPVPQRESVETNLKHAAVGAVGIVEKLPSGEAPDYTKMAGRVMKGISALTGHAHPHKQRHKAPARGYLSDIKEIIPREIAAVAIGSSLGGPRALKHILSQLNSNFPVPVLITQHISNNFSESLVEWLNSASSIPVILAKNGETALPGHAYVAPEDFHMEISSDNVIHLSEDPPEGGLRPAVSRLFRSMATSHGAKGVGVILTGMGGDGAEELLLMKKSGAITIAQSKESCAVFGMPQKAIAVGAATLVLPLENIVTALEHILERR